VTIISWRSVGLFAYHQCVAHNRTSRTYGRDGLATLLRVVRVAAAMSAPLFSQPSASKEELQNACSFVQSECNLHRRPYDMFSVLSGGLRPLYSGSSTESDLLTSINSLLSPPSPHDVSWNRQPGARYVPVAQEAFFKCGGLESLVASLRYPSAVNKPAICRYS
jgi:hypothetical protein